ncbi:MAG TPA: metallophosphoesterase [Bacillus sp. (in: firmicutes)]|uniref:metallophosphoesterase n=1 Tax=Bacillus litorisediminis TaxID=2922713 RepID=UPI001FAC1762|nr:metallophosphoesterase [Bacillus litorisediminis]HWO74880.1 metallophosphoesterase [Bacillus sp. (in: firmicutes)]
MKKKISRRSFLKNGFKTVGASIASISGGYYYAKHLEPYWLEINSYSIKKQSIPQGFTGTKIVQFSDTHLGFHYELQDLTLAADKIMALKPDIIVFTGDLMDEPQNYPYSEQIIPILQSLTAPLGKYAVYGNHDHGGYGTNLYGQIMKRSGFTLLQNEVVTIAKNSDFFYLAGLDDPMLGTPDFQAITDKMGADTFKLLLSHAPDLADTASTFGFHFQLSGHSHGGQVQIPFIGALVKPPFGEEYYDGFYEINKNQNLTLYVNRGLGTTRLPFRFLSRPEITVFQLESE